MRDRRVLPFRDTAAEIVVIEDDLALLRLMDELLVEEGFQVRAFPSAGPAWAHMTRCPPDVVLLDLRLGPGPDGWAVLDQLFLTPCTRHVPVVLMTGDPRALEQRAPVLGPEYGVYVLRKPFDIEGLLETITTAQQRVRPKNVSSRPRSTNGSHLRLVPSPQTEQ